MPDVSPPAAELRAVEPEQLLRYDRLVRRLASDLLGDPDAADDIAQQTWQAALTHPPGSRFAVASWLRRVVTRLAHNRRRAERRRQLREHAAARPELVPSDQDIWQREDARRAAVAALLALPEPYRATLVLRYLEDLAPAAVARRLDLPVETVRTRCKRGLQMIRQQLDTTPTGGDWRRGLLALPALHLGRETQLGATLTSLSVILVTIQTNSKVLAAALLLAVGGLVAWQCGSGGPGNGDAAPQPPESVALQTGASPLAAPVVADPPARALVATPSPAPQAAHGELRIRARLVGGQPAVALTVAVLLLDAPPTHFARVFARTDAAGHASLQLAAGRVQVASPLHQRAATACATVVAGAVTDCELAQLDVCAVVRGRVVDAHGRGIVGATLLGSDWSDDESIAVGESGADGRFELQHCAHTTWLGARHDDYAPSALRSVAGPPGTTLDVLLELGADAGSLRGMVLDANAQPVAGANVRIGCNTQFGSVPLPDGGVGTGPRGIRTHTDHTGAFAVRGLPPGELPLAVRAPGHARFATHVTITTRQASEVIVRLTPGATITGRATTPDGRPATAAEIRVADHRPAPELLSVKAQADADGTFTIPDLPAGKLRLRAEHPGVPDVEREFDLSAGLTERWDIAFVGVPPIVGKVVDSDGRGVAAADVLCWAGGRSGSALTNAQGDFAVAGVGQQASGTVIVQMRGSPAEALKLHDVEFGAEPLLLRLPPGAADKIEVRGRVVDAAGQPVVGTRLSIGIASSDTSTVLHVDAAGQFVTGGWPRVALRVSLEAAGYAHAEHERTAANDAAVLDFGDLVLQPAARLRVRVAMADGSPLPAAPAAPDGGRVEPFYTTLYDARGIAMAQLGNLQAGDLLRTDLAAGRYRLVVTPRNPQSDAIACAALDVEVVAGEERSYTCALRGGTRCRFSTPAPVDPAGARIKVLNWSDELVGHLWVRGEGDRRSGATVLVPGRYRAVWGSQTKEFEVGGADLEIAFD